MAALSTRFPTERSCTVWVEGLRHHLGYVAEALVLDRAWGTLYTAAKLMDFSFAP